FPSGPNLTVPPLWLGFSECGRRITSRSLVGMATSAFAERLNSVMRTSPFTAVKYTKKRPDRTSSGANSIENMPRSPPPTASFEPIPLRPRRTRGAPRVGQRPARGGDRAGARARRLTLGQRRDHGPRDLLVAAAVRVVVEPDRRAAAGPGQLADALDRTGHLAVSGQRRLMGVKGVEPRRGGGRREPPFVPGRASRAVRDPGEVL